MKRYLFLITLFCILAAATGFQPLLHKCAVTGSVTLGECAMCSHTEPAAKQADCCSEEEDNGTEGSSIQTADGCCETMVSDGSGFNWMPAGKTGFRLQYSILPLSTSPVWAGESIALPAFTNYSTHAPPPAASRQSLLSVFLI